MDSQQKVRFSHLCGKNVSLKSTNTEASWLPRHSSGWIYCDKPMTPGQTLIVKVEGSGHYDIGFITVDPNRTDSMGRIQSFVHLNDVRIHKKICRVRVKLNETGNEVCSYSHETFTSAVQEKIWLTVYLKFGEMKTCICRTDEVETCELLSSNHGANIRLDNDKKYATVFKKNPASTCFIELPVMVGEKVLLQCNDVKEGDRRPSRCELKVHVCEFNPKVLFSTHKAMFDTCVPYENDPPTTVLGILAKHECQGIIEVSLSDPGTILFVFGSNPVAIERTMRARANNGAWVLFELYRVSVSIVRRDMFLRGLDVVDSVAREQGNELALNTLDYAKLGRSLTSLVYSQYSSIQRIERLEHCQRIINDDITSIKRDYNDDSLTLVKQMAKVQTNNNSIHVNASDHVVSLEKRLDVIEEDIKRIFRFFGEPLFWESEFRKAADGINRKETEVRLYKIEKRIPSLREKINCSMSTEKDEIVNIQTHYVLLLRELETSSLCDHLFQEGLIDLQELREIQHPGKVPRESNRKVLELLSKRKVRKSQIEPMLVQTKQEHLLNKLFPEMV